MITNEILRKTFVSPNMQYYLHKKLAPVPPEEVDIRTEELLKSLNMSVYSAGEIPFSSEVDEVWHYWIMETVEYFQLCDKLHGKHYIHHTSNEYQEFNDSPGEEKGPDFDRALNILVSYVLNYGPFEERRVKYWPIAQRILDEFHWTVDQLNEWLKTLLEKNAVVYS